MSMLLAGTPAADQPSTFRRNLLVMGIMASWALTVATPIFATAGVQNAPPGPGPSSRVNLNTILDTWVPAPVEVQPRRFAPQAIQADAPPPFSRVTHSLILDTWTLGPDAPIRYNRVTESGAVSDSPQPSSRVTQQIVLATWEPPAVSPFFTSLGFQDGAVQEDAPPPLSRVNLRLIQNTWQLGQDAPQRHTGIPDAGAVAAAAAQKRHLPMMGVGR